MPSSTFNILVYIRELMAQKAFRAWDRVENAAAYDNPRNRQNMHSFLIDFDTAAHTKILLRHINRVGRKIYTFETLYDDADAHRMFGLTFAQARNAISLDKNTCIYHKFRTGDLRGCVVVIRMSLYHETPLSLLTCRKPAEKIEILAAYKGKK